MARALLALVVVATVLLAGCVSDDDGATSPGYVEVELSNADDGAHAVEIAVYDANDTVVYERTADLPAGMERTTRYGVAAEGTFTVVLSSADGDWQTAATWNTRDCDTFVVTVGVDDGEWDDDQRCETPATET